MVEAESTEATWDLVNSQGKTAPTEEVVAEGLEAAKGFIATLCQAQSELAANAAKEVQEFPRFLDYEDDAYTPVEEATTAPLTEALQIAGKQEREDRLSEIKTEMKAKLLGLHWDAAGDSDVDPNAPFAGRDKELDAAFRAVQKKLIRERIITDKVR